MEEENNRKTRENTEKHEDPQGFQKPRSVEQSNKDNRDELLMRVMNKEKKYKGAITVLALILVAVISYNLGSNTGTGGAVAELPTVNPPRVNPTTRTDVSIDDDPIKGDPNAPVTMIEFSDFECPFCGRFYSQTLDQIEKEYIETGKVKFVYRDFPLTSIHPNAQKAAEAGECAKEQGMFWEMHDKIFENQASLSLEGYKTWAAELGLDTQQFNECLDSGKYEGEVQRDLRDGTEAGVRGTPAFFVNGKLISGAQPFSAFKAAIDAEL